MARPSPLPPKRVPRMPDGPPEPVERPRCRSSAGRPGPSSTTWSSARSPIAAAARRTVDPAGAASRALASEVVDDLRHAIGVGDAPRRRSPIASSRDVPVGGQRLPRLARAPRRTRPSGDRRRRRARRRAARRGEREQAVDEAGQALDLGDGGIDVGQPGSSALEPQPQRGERRAQLVDGVGDEVLLGGDELLEARGHPVERRGEGADLGRPVVGAGARPRSPAPSAPAASCSRRSGRVTDRPRTTASPAADGQRDRRRAAEQRATSPDASVDLGGRVA